MPSRDLLAVLLPNPFAAAAAAAGVVMMTITLAGGDVHSPSSLRALRTLRALRPLRVASRLEGMKVVVDALFASLPPLGDIVLVCLLFYLVFGIMGVHLLAVSCRLRCVAACVFACLPRVKSRQNADATSAACTRRISLLAFLCAHADLCSERILYCVSCCRDGCTLARTWLATCCTPSMCCHKGSTSRERGVKMQPLRSPRQRTTLCSMSQCQLTHLKEGERHTSSI